MLCTELKVYIAYLVVQYIAAGALLGWDLVFNSRMAPTYLLSTAAGIFIMYFLCARNYKKLVWWLVAIAIVCGVSGDLLLLVDKRVKDFSIAAMKLADKGKSVDL
jgi:hypothetical protein